MSQPRVMFATNIATESLPSRFAIRAMEWLANHAGGREDAAVQMTYPQILFRESYLPRARCNMLRTFVRSDADYLVMVDCDEIWPANAIQSLVLRDLPVVSALYFSTMPPHLPIWRRWNEETGQLEVTLAAAPAEPFQVDAVGAGFLCIRRDVAEEVGENSFIPDLHQPWGNINEDFAFCQRARALGHSVWVDPAVRIGHLTMRSIEESAFLAYCAGQLRGVAQFPPPSGPHRLEGPDGG